MMTITSAVFLILKEYYNLSFQGQSQLGFILACFKQIDRLLKNFVVKHGFTPT